MGLALSGPSLPVWVAFLFLESESILTDIGHLISYYIQLCILILFLNDFIYLFLDTGREGERQEEKHQCEREASVGCLSHSPNQGPTQPRHVPWPGIELATLWFASQHSIHWVPQARAVSWLFMTNMYFYESINSWYLAHLVLTSL